MLIELIDTGYFYADGGAMFGAIPKSAWSRRYPSTAENTCLLAMRCALIRSDDGHIILIDNGAGDKHLKQLAYYAFCSLKDLGEELRKRGVSPEQVTDVVLTHLHFDHCGYTTLRREGGTCTPAFPKATHWVSRAQWENFCRPHPLEQGSYFAEDMQAIADEGLLRLVDTDFELCRDVKIRRFDGHTPGQLAAYLQTPHRTYVYAGDVIPLQASLSPEWISAYDLKPLVSYSEKLRMLEEAAQEKQAIIYGHDAYNSCSTVKKINNFYVKECPIERLD